MMIHVSMLSRTVGAGSVFTPESCKGSRTLTHPPRKHGGDGHGRVFLVPILIVLDRYENEADTALLDKRYQQIAPALQSLLSQINHDFHFGLIGVY